MRTITILVLLFFLHNAGQAQTFEIIQELILPPNVKIADMDVADVDNDGLLDVVLFATSGTQHTLRFVKGDTMNAPQLHPSSIDLPVHEGYVVVDVDGDNDMDILLSVSENGRSRSVLVDNKGAFHFELVELNLPNFLSASFTDLDNDGKSECIISGGESGNYFVRTYKNTGRLTWDLEHDTMKVAVSFLKTADLNGDGYKDLAVSGFTNSNEPFFSVFLRSPAGFEEIRIANHNVEFSLSDRDLDGVLDLICYGINGEGDAVYYAVSNVDRFAIHHLGAVDTVVYAKCADFNSDGRPDEFVVRRTPGNGLSARVQFEDGTAYSFASIHLEAIAQYDHEHDGDLDFIALTDDGSRKLIWVENKTSEANQGPSITNAFAVPIYDRTLLYWDKVQDDHTGEVSITYDVYLEGPTIRRDVSFDLFNRRRMRQESGNNDGNNFLMIRTRGENFNYAIQPIDNALFSASRGGVCYGSTRSGAACSSQVETIKVCATERMTLEAPEKAHWFSFSKGYLGERTQYEYFPDCRDTVFYLVSTPSCPIVSVFELDRSNSVEMVGSDTHYACVNSDVTLSIDASARDVSWFNDSGTISGNTTSITVHGDSDETVKVRFRNEKSCLLEKHFVLAISSPVITTNFSTYRMMAGQSIQLSSSGGLSYSWSPTIGLNNPAISDPIASPRASTRYTVTATDSVGCRGDAEVFIQVETSAFIPTLFTPNRDGQNDVLKVYALSGVDRFSLTIENRDGIVVYNSNNVSDVAAHGWNGETNGIAQPSGLYFWRVDGRLSSGEQLLLNGKREGSVLLLR